MTLDHARYLLILAGCVALTVPLEFFGGNVYRRPARLAKTVLPVAAVFLVWDVIAVVNDVWGFNPHHVSGLRLFFALPVEEVLFFAVIPICGLLTYGCVDAMLSRTREARRSPAEKDVTP